MGKTQEWIRQVTIGAVTTIKYFGDDCNKCWEDAQTYWENLTAKEKEHTVVESCLADITISDKGVRIIGDMWQVTTHNDVTGVRGW